MQRIQLVQSLDWKFWDFFVNKKTILLLTISKNAFLAFSCTFAFMTSKLASLQKMATLRNKRKLAAVAIETQEDHLRNGQWWNPSIPRINEDYITRVSEEIAGRVTIKLFHEFSKIKSRILGTLSKLHELLLNPQVRTHSGTIPDTLRNNLNKKFSDSAGLCDDPKF